MAARTAIDLVLKAHEPFPAIAIDRHRTLVASNAAVPALLEMVVDKTLLKPPVKVLRLSLAPGDLAPHIVNFREWQAHLLARLRHQIDVMADQKLELLLGDLQSHPPPVSPVIESAPISDLASIVVPFRFNTPGGILSLLSTTTVFGTPVEVTLSELALEVFPPADKATADALHAVIADRATP